MCPAIWSHAGDIVGAHIPEQAVSMVVEILGASIFAYLMGSM
jgi:hypothetical protein